LASFGISELWWRIKVVTISRHFVRIEEESWDPENSIYFGMHLFLSIVIK